MTAVLAERDDASVPARVRLCAWCEGPIPPRSRRDAIYCSVGHRQAAHRFKVSVGRPSTLRAAIEPLRLAYADPPYPGLSARYYGDHPDFAGEVDHAALIMRLSSTYDGWALSTSARALPDVLPLCPPGARVAAWFRGERPTRSAWPLNAWEPVIYWGGRQLVLEDLRDASAFTAVRRDVSSRPAGATRRVDALIHHARPRMTDPRRVIGAKPAAFAGWLFELLGALPGDTLDDVFPGSGGISRAWTAYTARTPISDALDRTESHEQTSPGTSVTP